MMLAQAMYAFRVLNQNYFSSSIILYEYITLTVAAAAAAAARKAGREKFYSMVRVLRSPSARCDIFPA
jgi:hypothetical protein